MTRRAGVLIGLGALALGLTWAIPRALDHLAGNVPIRFYGRVVDQSGRGIANLPVVVQVRGQPRLAIPIPFSAQGGRVEGVITKTDDNGNFEIDGGRGTSLNLLQSELPQYKQRARDTPSFDFPPTPGRSLVGYSAQDRYVVHLWKRGPTEPLYEGSVSCDDKGWQGRVFTLDLLRRKVIEGRDAPGDLRVSIRCPGSLAQMQGKFDWSFSIEAIDGGLVETNDPFPYLAPESGYRERYDYALHADDSDASWRNELQRTFYLRSRNGAVYASLAVSARPNYNDKASVGINYAANPAGSRNLEPDAMKRIDPR